MSKRNPKYSSWVGIVKKMGFVPRVKNRNDECESGNDETKELSSVK